MLFGRKDDELFIQFCESARVVVRGGEILKELIYDQQHLDIKMAKLSAMEHEGDRIIQDLIRRLNMNFILPFDREDAYQLAQKLAKTLDYITGIVDRIILYKAGDPDDTIKEMINVLFDALILQERAFNLLNRIEHNKKEIMSCCYEIFKLEKKQDSLYRSGVAKLFEEHENNPIQIIKWREVYENVESAQDYILDVAVNLSNICIKYS